MQEDRTELQEKNTRLELELGRCVSVIRTLISSSRVKEDAPEVAQSGLHLDQEWLRALSTEFCRGSCGGDKIVGVDSVWLDSPVGRAAVRDGSEEGGEDGACVRFGQKDSWRDSSDNSDSGSRIEGGGIFGGAGGDINLETMDASQLRLELIRVKQEGQISMVGLETKDNYATSSYNTICGLQPGSSCLSCGM
ncbi:unnamed protein product [Choristocarpus tenellus]